VTTPPPPPSSDPALLLSLQILLHFVCFVHKAGSLYELDGRKFAAINHGASSPATLLQDAGRVLKEYIRTTQSNNFSLMALAAAE
jgi:ubiquitin carboxyl-terminal hydrolase L3